MSTKAIMLKRDWQGKFRRSVRDEKGEILETLTFEPGVPLELNAEQYKAVKDDIGKALQEVDVDAAGRARVVMSDKEREELLLANAEVGHELADLTAKCIDLQKQVETLQATIEEQSGTITRQSEEIASLEEEVIDLEDRLTGGSEDGDEGDKPEPGSLESLGLAADVIDVLRGQGLDTAEKLTAYGKEHNGSYIDLNQIGEARNTAIIAAVAKAGS